ncbi:UNVERIFIED_CONTAM: hypothetical protein Sindi_1860900 [Sesamum indicum]
MNMRPSKSIKEVQKLAGKLASLNRFISQSADKGLHFFKILRGVAKFEWDKSSQEAFDELKRYLSSPPLLTKPKTGETLYLYLAISGDAVSSVLVLPNRKTSPLLITAAKKLRPYFQSHQVVVLTNHPSETSTFKSIALRKNGQSLHVDGLSTLMGSGAGIVLESPKGDKFEYAVKLEYPSSNNEPEYEAFLAGGELALAAGARKITIYSDSQLVVNQMQGSFETRDKKMAKYSLRAKNLLGKFEEASIVQVFSTENVVVDQLEKLASSMAVIQSRTITFLSKERVAIEEQEEVMCADLVPPS